MQQCNNAKFYSICWRTTIIFWIIFEYIYLHVVFLEHAELFIGFLWKFRCEKEKKKEIYADIALFPTTHCFRFYSHQFPWLFYLQISTSFTSKCKIIYNNLPTQIINWSMIFKTLLNIFFFNFREEISSWKFLVI